MKALLYSVMLVTAGLLYAQDRTEEILYNDWKFQKGSPTNAQALNFDDSSWEKISIPHDWAIGEDFIIDGDGNTGKLPWKGEGWYRRELAINSADAEKQIYLLFDGVMAFPEVYVNGQLAGKWDYGYNSFYLNITSLVKPGERNILAVYADTRQHDSRWYPGGGLYRKVALIKTAPVHTAIWGTYITTPIIKPNYAEVRVNTEANNATSESKEVVIKHEIYNPAGRLVASANDTIQIKQSDSKQRELSMIVNDPELWDITEPNLYSATTSLYVDGKKTDTYQTTFGIRTIAFTADDGFHLNGRRVQLKGVNLHHDHGPLGAAFNTRAMERQLEIMQSMGVNAVRNSHNVAAPELLELCDRMGILVFDEIFDKYDGKADITAETDFEEFAERNVRNFIKRDRNHPSIFLWSVGNEIGDVQWNIDNGFQRLHTMLNYVDKYDPSRPTTLVCDSKASASKRHFDYYDVHSWNYGRRYSLARQLEPNKSVVISESASTVSTRGFYELSLPEKKTDFTKSLQVSSYDLNAPEWAEIGDDDFMWQQDEPYVAGEFVWTGFDYLGEPTPYYNSGVIEMGFSDKDASRSSYFGIVDLVGLPKDRYYLYKSYWDESKHTVHLLPHWNWQGMEGQSVPVFAYTDGDCGELFVNGRSMGMQCKKPQSENSVDRFRLMWRDVIYQPGEIKVVAYKAGERIGEKSIKTTGPAYQLKATVDRPVISSGGQDLAYITIEALDKNGNPHPLADDEVTITVKGVATLAGAGNGNPQSFDPMQDDKVRLFYGKAVAIVQGGMTAGKVEVVFTTEKLKGTKATITIK